MALIRTKSNKSSSEDDQINDFPRPQTVTIKSPARTPTSHGMKAIGITQGQKQALIDNLQLEITERARKLRAQYTLQAQGLRTRIELRVNRIPKSLRSANMGELFAKHLGKTKQVTSSDHAENGTSKLSSKSSTGERPLPIPNNTKSVSPARLRGTKRKSDDIENADKENAVEFNDTLPNPKKRAMATTGTANRQVTNPSTVLSPKSSNSRTLPQSPIRPVLGSPQKSYISRPASPLKPMALKSASPAKATVITATANLTSMINDKAKPTHAKANTGRKATNPPATVKPIATRSKRGIVHVPVGNRSVSNTSNASNGSTATTIMKKGEKSTTAGIATTGKKKNINAGVRAARKKTPAAVEAPPVERRVLRKRG